MSSGKGSSSQRALPKSVVIDPGGADGIYKRNHRQETVQATTYDVVELNQIETGICQTSSAKTIAIFAMMFGCSNEVDKWFKLPENLRIIHHVDNIGFLPVIFNMAPKGLDCVSTDPTQLALAVDELRRIILPDRKGKDLPIIWLGAEEGAMSIYELGSAHPNLISNLILFKSPTSNFVLNNDYLFRVVPTSRTAVVLSNPEEAVGKMVKTFTTNARPLNGLYLTVTLNYIMPEEDAKDLASKLIYFLNGIDALTPSHLLPAGNRETDKKSLERYCKQHPEDRKAVEESMDALLRSFAIARGHTSEVSSVTVRSMINWMFPKRG